MFRIGEFSKIAQVSGRLLRYYDEIDLLKPVRVDDESGYRYYSATQLPRLNRILALKELGLSLDEIARLLNEDISIDEIHGMFLMKQAEVANTLREEVARLKTIETRLQHIEQEGALRDYDVLVKSIPETPFLSVREECPSIDEGRMLLFEIMQALPAKVGRSRLGPVAAVSYSEDFRMEDIDVALGFLLNEHVEETVELSGGEIMTTITLPSVQVATAVRVGTIEVSHLSYGAIGEWIETHNYRIAGPVREVFIEPPQPGHLEETVTEIQVPIEKIATEPALLP